MPWSETVNSYHISYAITPRTVRDSQVLHLSLLSPIGLLNLLLGGIAATLVLLYVLSANAGTANALLSKSLNDQALAAAEVRTQLLQQESVVQDPELLLQFAHRQGMVEQQNANYVFAGSNVAYRR